MARILRDNVVIANSFIRAVQVLFVTLGASLFLASCGTGGYIYINHVNSSGGDSYFKVPSSWTVFDQSQILKATSAQLPLASVRALESQSWSTIFSGMSGAKFQSGRGLSSPVPFGITQQLELTPSQSSSVTVASLRQVLLPSDPLSFGTSTPGLTYQVLSYKEFKNPGGLQGSTMEVKIIGSSGKISVLDQKAMLDAHKTWVYFIGVGCTDTCFYANRSAIEQVVNSWNVKER